MVGGEKYIVYLHINKANGKVYVGITHYTNPELRWRGGREYRKNVVFTRAISKYGWEGFSHIILFRNLPKEAACRIESKLITRYRKRNLCYNVADGGQGVSSMNSYIRSKISESCRGRFIGDSNPMRNLTDEQRKFHSEKMKRTWEIKRNLILKNQKEGFKRAKIEGRYVNKRPTLTAEQKDKIYSAVSKARSVPVLCFSENGVFIRRYKSLSEANMSFNIDIKDSNISRACRDFNKTAYGYRWRYDKKGDKYG
jgi:hypothetical protein